jgi:hypothetical protein
MIRKTQKKTPHSSAINACSDQESTAFVRLQQQIHAKKFQQERRSFISNALIICKKKPENAVRL